MTHTNDRRLVRIEQRAQHIGMISKPARQVFQFIDGRRVWRSEGPRTSMRL